MDLEPDVILLEIDKRIQACNDELKILEGKIDSPSSWDECDSHDMFVIRAAGIRKRLDDLESMHLFLYLRTLS
jgi:hypothetical protein